jgi:hypothetical protein
MLRTQEFSRSVAISLNKEKAANPVLLYVNGQEPICSRDIKFLSQNTKNSNTETFIMLNKDKIAFANEEILAAVYYKAKLNEFKKSALEWRKSIN